MCLYNIKPAYISKYLNTPKRQRCKILLLRRLKLLFMITTDKQKALKRDSYYNIDMLF